MEPSLDGSSYFVGRAFGPQDFVVSPKFGIGKVMGVEYISELKRRFFTIESIDRKTKNMIPIDSDILIRKISTKSSFNRSLDEVCSGHLEHRYSNRKDRIADYQKKIHSSAVTLPAILSLIKEMHSIGDKGAVEKQMLKELLEMVSKEYAFVFKCEPEEAEKIIRKRLIRKHSVLRPSPPLQ